MNYVSDTIRKAVEASNPITREEAARTIKLAANTLMNRVVAQGSAHGYAINVHDKQPDDSCAMTLTIQPTQTAERIFVTIEVGNLLNRCFYVMKEFVAKTNDGHTIDGGDWIICTAKDIYDPDYIPMVVKIGETIGDWEVFTVEEAMAKGMDIDDINVFFKNQRLVRK